MTYEEFQDLCEQRGVSMSAVAREIGFSFPGLRKSLMMNSMSAKNIVSVCNFLSITPNQFLSWKDDKEGDVNFGNMQKGAKKQVMTIGSSEELRKTIDMLEQELKTKNEQIAKLIEKL